MRVDYLLATDFLAARWAEGPDSAADRWLQQHADARLGLPWIVKAELLHAALSIGLNDAEVGTFLDRYPLLLPDEEMIRLYARLDAAVLGLQEQWLAACALRLDVPLVTNSLAEGRIPGLRLARF